MTNNIPILKGNLESLKHIHNEIFKMKHGKKSDSESDWIEFEPTRFMYNFIMFNTLYNICFDRGVKTGNLEKYPKRTYFDRRNHNKYEHNPTEIDQINSTILFCLNDKNFVKQYTPIFIRTICAYKDKIDIERLLEKIECVDSPNNITMDIADNFRSAVSFVLGKRKLDVSSLKVIYYFIYKVRCNIFHGTKSLDDLNKREQRKRLYVYSQFLEAISNMIFDYIDYLDELWKKQYNEELL